MRLGSEQTCGVCHDWLLLKLWLLPVPLGL